MQEINIRLGGIGVSNRLRVNEKYYFHNAGALPSRAPEPIEQRPTRPNRKKVDIIVTPKSDEPAANITVKRGTSFLTIALVMVLVLCALAAVNYVSAVQSYNRDIRLTQNERANTRSATANMRSILNESYNLSEVEEMAPRLGLARPMPHQEVRVYIRR